MSKSRHKVLQLQNNHQATVVHVTLPPAIERIVNQYMHTQSQHERSSNASSSTL